MIRIVTALNVQTAICWFDPNLVVKSKRQLRVAELVRQWSISRKALSCNLPSVGQVSVS